MVCAISELILTAEFIEELRYVKRPSRGASDSCDANQAVPKPRRLFG
jgi:hypothetical protein